MNTILNCLKSRNITVSCVLFVTSRDAQYLTNVDFNTTVHCSLLSNIFTIARPENFNVFPPIWQSYMNTILNCLESRKHCEAIMDDLLLFYPF